MSKDKKHGDERSPSVDEDTVALTGAELAAAAGAQTPESDSAGSDSAGSDSGSESAGSESAGSDSAEGRSSEDVASEESMAPENAAPEDVAADGIDPEDEVSVDPRTESDSASEAETSAVVQPGPAGWRRGFTSLFRPRLTGAGALIAVLVGLLGFALIAQVQSNSSTTTLSNDRPEDLVRILSDLDARKDRLTTEISSLQDTQRQLQSGAQGREAAIAEAARRADELGILAGTVGAQGPGILIHMAAGSNAIEAADVLDVVEELRGAGAEAMQVSGSDGTTVRIVASTYFVDGASGVIVDGKTLPGTLTVTAIGDPQTMQTALSIPGGAIDTTKQHGGNVQVESAGTVQVTALHPATDMKYARPTS